MKAMLIIDMVKGFINPETTDGKCALYLPGADSIIKNINREISKMGEEDMIIHLNDTHDRGDREFEMFPPHCMRNTDQSRTN